ncbi:hypothetical protein [Streptacidiphilus sp. EB129]|uniref:hypothetical protein n=1 Tax=Streptacidiphilus sp. EB129 TaxID=3156262 RepID=UPI003513584C
MGWPGLIAPGLGCTTTTTVGVTVAADGGQPASAVRRRFDVALPGRSPVRLDDTAVLG